MDQVVPPSRALCWERSGLLVPRGHHVCWLPPGSPVLPRGKNRLSLCLISETHVSCQHHCNWGAPLLAGGQRARGDVRPTTASDWQLPHPSRLCSGFLSQHRTRGVCSSPLLQRPECPGRSGEGQEVAWSVSAGLIWDLRQ